MHLRGSPSRPDTHNGRDFDVPISFQLLNYSFPRVKVQARLACEALIFPVPIPRSSSHLLLVWLATEQVLRSKLQPVEPGGDGVLSNEALFTNC